MNKKRIVHLDGEMGTENLCATICVKHLGAQRKAFIKWSRGVIESSDFRIQWSFMGMQYLLGEHI